MEQIYLDGTYQARNPTWHEEDAAWKAQHILGILKANRVVPCSFCEVGCGTGEVLAELARNTEDATFTGYDVSPQAIEVAVAKGYSEISFNLENPFAASDLWFDAVLAIDVIEHVEDYIGFLRNLRNLGRFKIFHIPLDLSVQSVTRMRPILGLRQSVGHLHYFTKDLAIAALTDCGYRVIDWKYTPSRIELPNQAFTSRIMAAPRRLSHKIHPDLAVRILGGYSLLILTE